MNVQFTCPHCQTAMETDAATGGVVRLECPACGMEFNIEFPEIPTVKAQIAAPARNAPQGFPPQTMPRHPQAGYGGHPQGAGGPPGYGYHSPMPHPHPAMEEQRGKGLTIFFVCLGVLLISGFSFLAVYLINQKAADAKAKTATASTTKPASPTANSKAAEVKPAAPPEETEEQAMVRREKERKEREAKTKVWSADLEKAKNEADARIYVQMLLMANGNTKVAKLLFLELEGAYDDLARLENDGDISNNPRAENIYDVLMGFLDARIKRHPELARWMAREGSSKRRMADYSKVPEVFRDGKYVGSGSGFWISQDGWMITNEHVVSSSPKVDLMPPDGKIISAKVVKVDVEKDLALLKADTIRTTWLPVSEGKIQPNLGMRVFTIGYPDPMQQGVAQKFIDGKISSLSGMRDNDGYFQTSLAVQGGNSGGPLVDVQSGWVVGVVAMKLMATGSGNAVDTVSYAIKGRILHEFLKSEPAAYTAVTAKASTPVKAGDESAVIKSCEASAALVLVLK